MGFFFPTLLILETAKYLFLSWKHKMNICMHIRKKIIKILFS
jgi:hypothetical protein